jgi:hypothetical protein
MIARSQGAPVFQNTHEFAGLDERLDEIFHDLCNAMAA